MEIVSGGFIEIDHAELAVRMSHPSCGRGHSFGFEQFFKNGVVAV
jgi:hypothetical protein